MQTATSHDGTTIAYDRVGSGPPLILVDGALCSRASGPSGPLAAALAHSFSVYTYDRRGRGDSGSGSVPYAVGREVEDIEALIAEAGGSAYLYGISSGGALALEAANALGNAVPKLALYELPFVTDDTRPPLPANFADQLREMVDSDREGEAVKHFLTTGVQVPGIFVAMMRFMPAWKRLKAVAHTLPYDIAILGPETGQGGPLPVGRWNSVAAETVVIDGGKSPAWMRNSAAALAELLGADHRTLEGQTHMVKPGALAPVLIDWFEGATAPAGASRA
jgi:pimeloyl-ACP methyl ester carboxylesterase